jgi:hypothetical protein
MRIWRSFWRVLFLTFLIGCTTQPKLQTPGPSFQTTPSFPTNPTRTVGMAATASPTPIPSITIMPTPTSAGTPAISPTPQSITPRMQQKCLQTLSTLPPGKSYDGTIIFFGKFISGEGKTFLHDHYEVSFFNLKTRQTVNLQKYKTDDIAVSPDHKKYALLDVNDYLVKVFTGDGRPINTISRGEEPYFIDRWLDDQTIELTIAKGYLTYNYGRLFPPNDSVIADLFTNKQQLIPPTYPDIDPASGISWDGGSTTEYDSTLSRVVYPAENIRITNDYYGNSGWGYILWDMVNKKSLVQLVTYTFFEPPKWSPDYSKFMIGGEGEGVYAVTRDGKVTQMIHFGDAQNKQPKLVYAPQKYSWSPDGRYVAFWLLSYNAGQSESGSGNLVILDTNAGETIDTCISAGFVESVRSNKLSDPVWSPDGKELVINANIQENETFDTLFVDLEDGSATKIGEHLLPMGWLINSPN